MSDKQSYTITSLAGSSLAGRQRLSGPTILLTPEEAEYELLAGTIVPNGQPVPPPQLVPAVKLTDTLIFVRDGATREIPVSDLVAFLRGQLGSTTTPTPPVTSPPASSSPGTISTDLSDVNSIGPRV